ncbi:MAG: FAD-dependent oxidoreductase [Tepidiformaceae bacterium]
MSTAFRVAIIGAGPSAFYAADQLLRQTELEFSVDVYDRLPTPYGLVRAGVAPDHQKIKTVTKSFAEIAAHPRFRFFGFVEFGTDVTLSDLGRHYHQVLFATGAQSDKRMGIPGEDLVGSHPATEFVAWYNGHPAYSELQFDLDCERVAIVGVGNVAIDVARILCLSPDELARTDMADHAIEALSRSRVREVHLLGRRGLAQAAFTNPEIKELGDLEDADIFVRPEEAELDLVSLEFVEASGDRALKRKVDLIQSYAGREPVGRSRKLVLRFLVSPLEIVGDARDHVASLRLGKNTLTKNDAGSIAARPTGETEDLAVGLVLRSVGYRGVPLPGVPFNDRWGVILNQAGRILDPATNEAMAGLYTTGWIKRGPSGVIGTNKPDAAETVACLVEDARAGKTLEPAEPDAQSAADLVHARQPRAVSFADWCRLDALEVRRGQQQGRPRVKFTSVEEMLGALQV